MQKNNLKDQSSPYLLQHVYNPVDWHPWGDIALEKAKTQDKPIFLSIGYSACHWCHVMAHESFENDNIAKIMNENFINIKVDREQRPDIDQIYQEIAQLVTGQGGWPLSIFLTPTQKPFYVGTYFPPLDSYGRPGFQSVLLQMAQAWKERPHDVTKSADKCTMALHRNTSVDTIQIQREILDVAAKKLASMIDTTHGGFGSAPKFPNAANISFMFRYYKMSNDTRYKDLALYTLDKMARGGIFDQVGGGFHRYSTDAKWFVPHFEKMLYDNALIPINYAEAYQITKDVKYLDIMKKTLKFVLRDLRSKDNGFYCALDADSQGQEGKYYTWSKKQIKEILGNDADIYCMFYDITDGGNWEGDTILYNSTSLSGIAFQFGLTDDLVREKIENCSKKLLKHRSNRVSPGLDDKIITSWNALMISALVKGYRVSNEESFLQAARKSAKFIKDNMVQNTTIYRDSNGKILGYLDDYAYYTNALLDLFEIDADVQYLNDAKLLAGYIVDHFWGETSFFMTSDNHKELIIRPKNRYDLSMPSGNSVAVCVMLRLYYLTHIEKFKEIAVKVLESQAMEAKENPFAFGYLLNTMFMYLSPIEITILNDTDTDMVKYISDTFSPQAITVTIPTKERLEKLSQYPFFADKKYESRTSVFVCKDFVCSVPLYDVKQLREYLE